jgi:hypothetical protein
MNEIFLISADSLRGAGRDPRGAPRFQCAQHDNASLEDDLSGVGRRALQAQDHGAEMGER